MQDLVVEEGGPAELLCQYSRPVQATWKMDEQEVRADGRRVIIEQDWTVARLSFRPALPCDSGIYSCEAAGTRVAALLHVQGEALHGSGVAGAILNGAEAGSDSQRLVTMPERQGPAGRPPLLPEQPDRTGAGLSSLGPEILAMLLSRPATQRALESCVLVHSTARTLSGNQEWGGAAFDYSPCRGGASLGCCHFLFGKI